MLLNRRDIRPVLVRASLFALLGILALAGIGLVIASVLLAFMTVAPAALATLLTALCIALAILPIAMFLTNDRRRHRGTAGGLGMLMPGLQNLIRQKPVGAIGTALAVGLLTEWLQRDGSSSNRRQ